MEGTHKLLDNFCPDRASPVPRNFLESVKSQISSRSQAPSTVECPGMFILKRNQSLTIYSDINYIVEIEEVSSILWIFIFFIIDLELLH